MPEAFSIKSVAVLIKSLLTSRRPSLICAGILARFIAIASSANLASIERILNAQQGCFRLFLVHTQNGCANQKERSILGFR